FSLMAATADGILPDLPPEAPAGLRADLADRQRSYRSVTRLLAFERESQEDFIRSLRSLSPEDLGGNRAGERPMEPVRVLAERALRIAQSAGSAGRRDLQ